MIYKEIPSCPGYKISKEGVVIGRKGEIRFPNKKGQYQFRINGRAYQRSLGRLLSETWGDKVWIDKLEDDEDWKVVDGFDDYIITSKGRVWSKKKNTFLTHSKLGEYYTTVCLMKDNKVCNQTVHKLVGRNFLKEYKKGLHILHKDENLPYPEINYVSNLWVGTMKDNMKDMEMKGRSGKSNKYGLTGVSKNGKKFMYLLTHNGKTIYVSGFSSPLEAHQAYLAKRMELKGY